MVDRRKFLVGTAGAGLAVAVGSGAGAAADTSSVTTRSKHYGSAHVTAVTAITQVFGIGQKLTAAVVEFDEAIDHSRLSRASFRVRDRTVTKVYANRTAGLAAHGRDGRYVVIELSHDDAAALLWVQLPMGGGGGGGAPSSPTAAPSTAAPTPTASASATASTSPTSPSGGGAGGPQVGDDTPGHKIVPASVTVTQTAAVFTTEGRAYAPDRTTSLISSKVRNLIVDDFDQFSYTDPATGRTLPYNLFIPESYDGSKAYPLVLFMHDAGVVAVPTEGPLVQGTGAVVWASPEDQAKNPCFVLAPQYPAVVISDDYKPSTYFDATVNLLKHVAGEYNVDHRRIYSTGQSMGAMLTLGINIRHPGLLAASYVVAGQWPADQAKPLADANLWVTVSEGDTKAFPMENEIMAVIRAEGTKVAQARWTAKSTQAEFAADVKALERHYAPINYSHFQAGTLPGTGPGGTGMEHTSTWQVAYNIPGIRQWIMRQSL